MSITILHIAVLFILSVLTFQALFGLFNFVLNKNKVYLFYSIYLLVIIFNFSQNFATFPIISNLITNNFIIKKLVASPINFLVNASYLLFFVEYFELKKSNPKLYSVTYHLFIINIVFCIICFFNEIFLKDKFPGTVYVFNLITLLLVIYPLYIMWKTKMSDYFFILLGSLVLMSFFILSIISDVINHTFSTNINTDFVALLGTLLEVLFFNYAIQVQLRKKEKELIIANYEMQHALTNEHKRLSADIHDEIGSTLSNVQVLSILLKKNLHETDENALKLTKQISNGVSAAQQSLSDIVWGLRVDLNTVKEVIVKFYEVLQTTLEPNDINYTIKASPLIEDLPLSTFQKSNLVLVFKEAINNILKYAVANNVTIIMSTNNDFLHMEISDDGIGFDTNELPKKTGNGLRNMLHRMQKLQGSFSYKSEINAGTILSFTFPIQ